MTTRTLLTATCAGCGAAIMRQPDAPHWMGGRDWHDPDVLDEHDDGTRCDGTGREHEPEPVLLHCKACDGAGEVGTRQDYWGNWDTETCRLCQGEGQVTAERLREWAEQADPAESGPS